MIYSILSPIPPSCWWRGIGCGATKVPARPGWTGRPPCPSRSGSASRNSSTGCGPPDRGLALPRAAHNDDVAVKSTDLAWPPDLVTAPDDVADDPVDLDVDHIAGA